MKKGKVFGKTQIAVTVMVFALAGAIWLNMKYTPSSGKYLGEASYVSNSSKSDGTLQTSAKTDEKADDYFTETKKAREKARKEASDSVTETLKNSKLTEEDKTGRAESESKIEALLKAKGFENVLAVQSDTEISIVVKSEGLTSAQTLQIQDVVTSQTNIPLSGIKIIPVK